MKMDIEYKKALLEHLKKITVKFAGKAVKTDMKELSETEKQLVDILNSGKFGSIQEPMSKILSTLTGKDLDKYIHLRDSESIYKFIPMFTVVVATSNQNGHNYPLEKPLVFSQAYTHNKTSYTMAFRPDGTIGNNMGCSKTDFRPATIKEIYKLTEDQLEAVSNMVVVLEVGKSA